MLGSFENSGVGRGLGRAEGDLHGHAARVGHLRSALRHGVSGVVEGQVHVLGEEFKEVDAVKPSVDLGALCYLLPDLTLLAGGALGEVLRGIELGRLGESARLGGRVGKLLSLDEGLDFGVEARFEFESGGVGGQACDQSDLHLIYLAKILILDQ